MLGVEEGCRMELGGASWETWWIAYAPAPTPPPPPARWTAMASWWMPMKDNWVDIWMLSALYQTWYWPDPTALWPMRVIEGDVRSNLPQYILLRISICAA